eukprot:3039376-Lingulodinium_polyedra.AAC.1
MVAALPAEVTPWAASRLAAFANPETGRPLEDGQHAAVAYMVAARLSAALQVDAGLSWVEDGHWR